jgi:hypothetical protein
VIAVESRGASPVEQQLKTAVANMRGLRLDAVKRADALSFVGDIAPKETLQKALEIAYDGANFEDALRELEQPVTNVAEEMSAAAPEPSEVAEVVTVKEPEMTAVEEPVTSVAEVEVETPAVKSPTPIVVEQHESSYSAFELFDVNNPEHRIARRITYNGYYFVKRALAADSAVKMAEHHAQYGKYPYGVVEGDGGIHDACFPIENSVNLTDAQWVNQARAFRDAADYDDSLYAEWPDLQPCAGELKPVLAFNTDWLPDAIRPFVIDVGERMSVSVDFPAMCALTCLSGATSHRAFVYPLANDKDFAEPLNVSGAVIALSGKKKTPTWKILMNPLVEWEKDQDRSYEERVAEYMKDLNKFNILKKDIDDHNREEKRLANKEKRDPVYTTYEKLPAVPKEPEKPRRLVVNDSTPEQIHEIAKTNPQGLFYYRDELSGWAAELDMTGREGSRSMFLQGMTGDHDHTVDRVGRDGGYAKVTLSIFGSFQPALFVNFLSESKNVEDGTIPRFPFLVWPDDERLPILDRAINLVAKTGYRQIVRRLADLPDKGVHIHFDKDAQQIFYNFQRELRDKVARERNLGKRSHLSKYEGGLARIAALLQLVDTVAALPEMSKLTTVALGTGTESFTPTLDAPREIRVDVDHLQRALGLLGYLESHMHRVYDSKVDGIDYRKLRLLEHLRDGSIHDGMSANEIIHKGWAGLSQKFTSGEAVDAALEELVPQGWVRLALVEPGKVRQGGRPTKRWNVNPEACGAGGEYEQT